MIGLSLDDAKTVGISRRHTTASMYYPVSETHRLSGQQALSRDDKTFQVRL